MNSTLIFKSEVNDDGLVTLKGGRAAKLIEDLKINLSAPLPADIEIKLGIHNGERILGNIISAAADNIKIKTKHSHPRLTRKGIEIIVAVPRPQAIKRIIQSATLCGIKRIIFYGADNSQKSYLQSSELTPQKYNQQIIESLELAWDTAGPEIIILKNLKELEGFLGKNCPRDGLRFFCHSDCNLNGSNAEKFSVSTSRELICAVGPERGWSKKEIDWFVEHKFHGQSFGERILRVDTAVLYAIGFFDHLLADRFVI